MLQMFLLGNFGCFCKPARKAFGGQVSINNQTCPIANNKKACPSGVGTLFKFQT